MKIPNLRKTNNESTFQRKFVKWLEEHGAKTLRFVANGANKKGKPDVAVFYKGWWGWLEFKKSADAPARPGQKENVEWASKNSYGSFVYPEISDWVKTALLLLFMEEDEKCEKSQR